MNSKTGLSDESVDVLINARPAATSGFFESVDAGKAEVLEGLSNTSVLREARLQMECKACVGDE